jgi:predicted nucleotidyltransferase component of viral defense system
LITAQEIAQWRPHAPWSSDLMVEQDFLLSQAVAAIFEDKFLKDQVAMRGGTVLHKAHLAPASRYSEDIDLVLTGDRPASHIKRALARVLKPIVGNAVESVLTDIQLTVRNLVAKSKIIRTTYTYDPTSHEAALAHLKVEVNINESKSHFPLVPVTVQVPASGGGTRGITVMSYDLDEMLGTKLRALLQREAGRDLFDLYWAWDVCQKPGAVSQVNPARVAESFRFYMEQEGSSFSAQEIRSELERRMKSRRFLADMEGYLAVGQTYSVGADPILTTCAD